MHNTTFRESSSVDLDKIVDLKIAMFKDSGHFDLLVNNAKKNERGKGISSKLTEIALNWFKDNNITTIRLLASEEGRKLYKKFGFNATDEMVLEIKM